MTTDDERPAAMTPEQFAEALAELGWKQADFCRRTGVSKDTPSRWMTGKTPIQAWVPAYLGAMLDLSALYRRYAAPIKASHGEEDTHTQ